MALVRCPDCGREVSDQAPTCPNCGRPLKVAAAQPTQKGRGGCLKTGCGVVVVLFIIGIVANIANPPKPKTRAEIEADSLDNIANEGVYYCEKFVEARLKAPSTATFSNERGWVVKNKPGHYSAAGNVDAQNAFGAQLRSTFACDMKREGNGDWQALRVYIAP